MTQLSCQLLAFGFFPCVSGILKGYDSLFVWLGEVLLP